MKDRLTKGEITKDALQSTVEAGAETVAAVSTILTGAVRDVARALGGFATEVFEIRDASRRARAEAGIDGPADDVDLALEAAPGPGPDVDRD
jgi:hypothetical protein